MDDDIGRFSPLITFVRDPVSELAASPAASVWHVATQQTFLLVMLILSAQSHQNVVQHSSYACIHQTELENIRM